MGLSQAMAAQSQIAGTPVDGIARFLKKQAEAHPDSAAAIFEGQVFTYRELLHRAQGLSHLLLEGGLKKGDRVGVLFPNNPDFISAFFAVTELGGVVVPINPLLKSDEIAHILQDSHAHALVVHERCRSEVFQSLPELAELQHVFILQYAPSPEEPDETAGGGSASLHCIDATDLSSVRPPAAQSAVSIAGGDLAVLVYTSGTTGKPKGAMLTHDNLLSAVEAADEFLSITSADRFLAVLPLCHIYGLTVVMLGLISKGGALVIQEKFDACAVLKLIESHAVTLLPAVPAMYQFMLMQMEKENYDLSSLRVCLCGAAPLSLEILNRLQERFPAPIVEGYGLTEASCVVSINPIGKSKHGSVGVPFSNIQVAIVGPDGKHLPLGKDNVGEIAVKGPNIMQGYYEKPEATAECLRDGWFFTGDLGARDEDGYLYIVGRTKELIIRGGANIYPREIEDVLSKMREVAEAAVIGVPDALMGERVKAVIALREDASLTEECVKQFCARHLAEYKVPRIVQFVASLPRNSTGKVLKRLL